MFVTSSSSLHCCLLSQQKGLRIWVSKQMALKQKHMQGENPFLSLSALYPPTEAIPPPMYSVLASFPAAGNTLPKPSALWWGLGDIGCHRTVTWSRDQPWLQLWKRLIASLFLADSVIIPSQFCGGRTGKENWMQRMLSWSTLLLFSRAPICSMTICLISQIFFLKQPLVCRRTVKVTGNNVLFAMILNFLMLR